MYLGGVVNKWVRSLDFSRVYTTKEEAENTFGIINGYRARRIDIPGEWIVEYSSPPNIPWTQSNNRLTKGIFSSESEALSAIKENEKGNEGSGLYYRARKSS